MERSPRRIFAQKEDVKLTDAHWDVIRFMREYYEEHQIAPDARYVIKHLSQRMGADARNALFRLFAYGYVKQACKIAGMKRPRARLRTGGRFVRFGRLSTLPAGGSRFAS